VPRKDVVIRGAGVLVVAGVLAAGGSYVVDEGGGGGEAVTANLFIQQTAGSTSCVRSSSLLEYDDALSANAVCKGNGSTNTGWDVACDAATGGDIVGVMPDVYVPKPAATSAMMSGTADCSDGAGADYDPNYAEKGNSPASLDDWVTFVAGEDCEGDPNISFSYPMNFYSRDFHLIVKGECFNFNRTVYVATGGVAIPQNLIFRGTSAAARMNMYGLQVAGAKNVMFSHIDYGPNVQCAANDTNATPAYFRCDPSGPYFESLFATIGTNAAGCTPNDTGLCAGYFPGGSPAGSPEFVEPYFHQGSITGNPLYENLRLDDFHVHDGQAKGTGPGVHPGCFMFDGNQGAQGVAAHNFVMNNVSCERQVVGIQSSDGGFTLQNSYIACSVLDLAQTTGDWDNCSPTYSQGLGCINQSPPNPTTTPGCTQQNVLIRYNVFYDDGGGTALLIQPTTAGGAQTSFGAYSNVRIVGNIFMGEITGCAQTGVTCANNSFYNASTAGSNATTLSCDPTLDSDFTNGGTWSETTLLNPRLNGSSCGVPSLNPGSLGADYQLGFDIDGDARGSTSTRAGVEN
jgi:hypothetical protein